MHAPGALVTDGVAGVASAIFVAQFMWAQNQWKIDDKLGAGRCTA